MVGQMKQIKLPVPYLDLSRLVGVSFTLTDYIDSVDKFADDFKQFTDKSFICQQNMQK